MTTQTNPVMIQFRIDLLTYNLDLSKGYLARAEAERNVRRARLERRTIIAMQQELDALIAAQTETMIWNGSRYVAA